MPTESSQQSVLTGTVLFYSRPEPLDIGRHGTLGITPSNKPFSFAQNAQAVPLQVTEFSLAARLYPIIFVGEDRSPMAAMGAQADQNAFIQNGRMPADAYIPAFIRRYPFILANAPAVANSPNGQAQMVVCIDRDADAIAEGGEVPLFQNGQPSDFTRQMVEFCSSVENDSRLTALFVARLQELDLFEPQQVHFTPASTDNGAAQPVLIANYFGISEAKLNALPAEIIKDLHACGLLSQIYAYFDSLSNWDPLIGRSFR